MKHLLFYSGITDGVGEQLKDILKQAAPNEETEVCRTIQSLAYKLLPLRSVAEAQKTVHVLVATSPEELDDIYSIRDLLSDLKIILVAPNRNHDTITKAHELFPRYLSYLDEDLNEVGAVFGKMVGNI